MGNWIWADTGIVFSTICCRACFLSNRWVLGGWTKHVTTTMAYRVACLSAKSLAFIIIISIYTVADLKKDDKEIKQ